jgi:hypothetical protein
VNEHGGEAGPGSGIEPEAGGAAEPEPEAPADPAMRLDELIALLPHLTDGDLLALAAHGSDADRAALDAVRGRVDAAARAAGRAPALDAGMERLRRWTMKNPYTAAGVLGVTDGTSRLALRMSALPALVDAVTALAAGDAVDPADAARLLEPWDELERPGEGLGDEADLDVEEALEAVHEDRDDGARL